VSHEMKIVLTNHLAGHLHTPRFQYLRCTHYCAWKSASLNGIHHLAHGRRPGRRPDTQVFPGKFLEQTG